MPKNSNKKVVARNKRAKYDYEIEKTYVAGLSLKGYEVKSAKAGHVSLRDCFVRTEKGEAWLINTHFALWKFTRVKDYEPKGRRKLLLTRKEIKELFTAQEGKNMVIVPLEIFVERGKLKLKMGIGKGRRKYDKKAKIKERELKRQLKEELASLRKF